MKRLFLLLFLAVLASPLSAKTIVATSGNQSSVQSAVDSASPGDTVQIPDGTFSWSGTLGIGKAIILKGQNKDATTISCKNSGVDTIKATEPLSGNLEIADLDFDFVLKQNTTNFVIRVGMASPRGSGRVLVHDCNFKSNYAYSVEWGVNGGVMWNCNFDGTNADGLTGISFVGHGNDDEWMQPSTLGTLDTDGKHNTYIEDCSFTFAPIAMCNFDDNSRTVIRHCSFQDAALGSHGQETSPKGARQWELYDCTFKSDPENKYNMNAYFGVRGGTGVVTDNDMGLVPWSKNTINLCVYSTRRKGQIPCQTSYPAARQIGQGWKGAGGYNYPSVPEDGTGYFTDPIYVWNNRGDATKTPNFVSPNQYEPDECGNNQPISKYVQKDRDYFLSAKPGYAKYPYPHPMRVAAEGGPTPNPTPTATPIPPTPSPSPTATPPQPTPTPRPPVQTWEKWIEDLNNWIRAHPPTPDQS